LADDVTLLPAELVEQAAEVLETCRDGGLTVVTAESCTGGLVAGCLTEIAGSSDVVDRGLVTYSNEAKTALLGVSQALLEEHGAVSEAVAEAMARGALAAAPDADLAIAITGIAGPGGGTEDKPVGTVWFGIARREGDAAAVHQHFDGDRAEVRRRSVETALALLLAAARAA